MKALSSMLLALLSVAAQSAAAPAAPQSTLVIKTIPAIPLIEIGREQQLVNFDIVVENKSSRALHLERINVEAFDSAGSLITRKTMENNGFPSAIETVPDRDAPAHGVLGVFNPFFAWPLRADIARMRYTLTFSVKGQAGAESASVSFAPVVYHDRTALAFPLKGRVFVLDG
ncbi:MAG: hypothetical protein JO293_03555, partial [Candidatus Eremiobacteraeota bacterium]|nr:hypothetical protein [Candidatus Eremiobacteraeota bacterium]